MANKVGTKGQLVIEKPIRDQLGIEPGHLAVQQIAADHLEIRFYPPGHERSLRGLLAASRKRSVHPEEWHEAKDEAWRTAVRVTEPTEGED